MVVTIIPRNLVTLFLIYSAAFLLRLVFSLLSGNLVAFLLSFVISDLLILSVAFLPVVCSTILLGYLVALLLGHN